MSFPLFTYHPKPIETGSVKISENICEVCNEKRGYVIVPTMYCEENVENICPWCVADGRAVEKFNGDFVSNIDNYEILTKEVIEEICTKTVSFSSYQEEEWLTHCNDGCEFHGLAKVEDIKKISDAETKILIENSSLTVEDIESLKKK